jgi:hypothetical protein
MQTPTTLAAQEAQLAEQLAAVRGSRAQRAAAIEAAGLDVAFRAVLRGYLALATMPESTLEAVKRAAYLAWCASLESRTARGFGAITTKQRDAVLRWIERLQADRIDDAELWAILAHCHAMVPTLFDSLAPSSAIRLLLERSAREDHASQVQIPLDPWQRGYLGYVFASQRA